MRRGGCGFLLVTSVMACGLFILNAALVAYLYPVLQQMAPTLMEHAKFKQAVLIFLPLLLLAFQWWTIDLLIERLALRRQKKVALRAAREDEASR